MKKCTWYLIFTLCLSGKLFAQIFPQEGALLHYRIVGFTVPQSAGSKDYKLEVARGNFFSADSFSKNIVCRVSGSRNRIIAEVPSFGTQYTWRVVSADRSAITANQLYHFSTGMVPAVDTLAMRVKILHAAEKFKDAYVFMDGNKALYDMNGKPVWYIPVKDNRLDLNQPVRDLKLSHRGTITFMSGQPDGEQIYEMDYEGNILWKGPNDGKVSGEPFEYYHHQFTRLSNGHYMVLGDEFLVSAMDSGYTADSNILERSAAHKQSVDHLYAKVPLVTIIEYDENGKLVWSWKSSDYFLFSDVRYKKRMSNAMFEDVHGNGFFFDQQKQYIYISFRDISRIVKIHYPDGKVAGEYGKKYIPGQVMERVEKDHGNGFYCYQHYCIPAESGSLYVFNNNSCNQVAGPTVVKLKEPDAPGGELTKVWEYNCKVEPPFDNKDFSFFTGGNIAELPGNSLFINMGGIHSKLSIVSPEKKELWSALPEQQINGQWGTVPQYRASIFFRNDMERLIFGQNAAAVPADGIRITYNSNQ